MKYLIYVSYDLFGKARQDIWEAPNEQAKDCMVKSAKENDITVDKVEEVI